MAIHTIYQIEAKLDDFQPVISRTILINAERSLAYLGYTLISAFGLEGSHLFGFQKSFELFNHQQSYYYFLPAMNLSGFVETDKQYNVMETNLNQFFSSSNLNNQLSFQYDFGDNWKISLNVESIETKAIFLHDIPTLIGGSGYGLIEDIGGNSGLHDYIEAFGSGDLDHYYQIFGNQLPYLRPFSLAIANEKLKPEISILKRQYEDNE
ncbi:plasmid pRiA4b ORF-3 family protein [Leuconostoc gelidum subsp. gasicomitatum]|uniref:plasmid pRiA4b ORF-3 family protein n=1 Tax=Leuconostoc gasicomitatum TaxID=115778 RepID=UPI001CC44E1A|nr:plasmid pRiA4b ORF-3 family protein [Leuconostoc gasicomitatum]MBZ5984128.1 plasmid pRiA4b ORF-3 family protein [Leuconostoc gasicomitatum]